jgi:D-alanyl-D-alanine carboxypeptidase
MVAPRVRRRHVRRTSSLVLASLLGVIVAGWLPSGLVQRAAGFHDGDGAPVSAGLPTGMAIAGLPLADAVPTLTADLRTALRARLDEIRTKYAIPGISVALVFPDGTTWVGTGGTADLAREVPITPDTAFAVASITKTFTAALIMALAQDGDLTLDAPVTLYLPTLDLDPKITVRQLLDHTSGLHDYFLDPKIDAALLEDPDRRWGAADALDYVGKPYFKPGRGWHYSNTNYLVLGLLAEEIGDAPLADQLRIRFLEPLGLSHTYYQPAEVPRGPVAHGYRFASAEVDEPAVDLSDGTDVVPFTSVVTAAAGAGGMAASAGDVARWARALYAGGVLAQTSVRAMVDDVALTERYRPGLPYGLGVQAVEVGGRPTLGHSGRLLGFRSVVRWLPEDGVTIAVLTNQSRTDPGIIARALLKVALEPTGRCACAPLR